MFLFIILLQLSTTSNSQISPITACNITNRGWCEFQNIRTTEDHPSFQPGVSTARQITRIFFTDSQIPSLTSEICTSFPELRRLDVEKVGLTTLQNKSLEKCSRLQHISFFANDLRVVHRDTFKRNTGLQFISLSWNKIAHIDMTTFSHLYLLEELALDNNRLILIDFGPIGELTRMSILYLGSNQLIEVSEKIIVKIFPNLRKIYLEDNLLPCLRVQGILDELAVFNVSLGRGVSYKRADVHFERKIMKGVDCLDSRAYNEMLNSRFSMEVEAGEVAPVEEEDPDFTCWFIGGGIAIILFLTIIFLCLYFRCRRRNQREMPNGDYYYGGGDYGASPQKPEY